MIQEKLFETFQQIIETCGSVILSTIDLDGYPQARAMLNLYNPEMFPKLKKYFSSDFVFYFATNTSSKKIKHIALNQKASVYFVKENSFGGLLFTGEIEIIQDKKIKQSLWQDGWTMYYKDGVKDTEYAVLKFKAEKYKYYNGQLEVVTGEVK
jgi:general stress protein 26